jgi:hypothetical protein
MSDPIERLRDGAGSLEQELLDSATEDRPAPDTQPAALAAVLERRRRELAERRQRLLAGVAAGLVLAAVIALFVRGGRPPAAKVAAEPAATMPSAHAPSASGVSSLPASPLAPCTPVAVGSGQLPLIDDFEDGDSRLLLSDKRAGSWVVFNDGTGQQQPRAGATFPADRIPGGRDGSHFGLHTYGSKFTKWGAVLSVELSPRRCYDASAYAGIAFWARGRAKLRVAVKMTQIVGEEFGGSCLEDCYDGHGASRTLNKDWQRYTLRWEDLAQTGFGTPLPFDPHSLFSVEFAVSADQPSFDFWVDDLSFLPR